MSKKFKVGELVTLTEGFPFEDKVFIIVADKNSSWKKATPFSFDPTPVDPDKDFILLVRQKSGEFSTEGIGDNGLHVNENEIKHYDEKYSP